MNTSNTSKPVAVLASHVLIITKDSIFGPFEDQATAQSWLDNGHAHGSYEMYSLRTNCELGTIDRADECGARLHSIEESTQRRAGGRATAG